MVHGAMDQKLFRKISQKYLKHLKSFGKEDRVLWRCFGPVISNRIQEHPAWQKGHKQNMGLPNLVKQTMREAPPTCSRSMLWWIIKRLSIYSEPEKPDQSEHSDMDTDIRSGLRNLSTVRAGDNTDMFKQRFETSTVWTTPAVNEEKSVPREVLALALYPDENPPSWTEVEQHGIRLVGSSCYFSKILRPTEMKFQTQPGERVSVGETPPDNHQFNFFFEHTNLNPYPVRLLSHQIYNLVTDEPCRSWREFLPRPREGAGGGLTQALITQKDESDPDAIEFQHINGPGRGHNKRPVMRQGESDTFRCLLVGKHPHGVLFGRLTFLKVTGACDETFDVIIPPLMVSSATNRPDTLLPTGEARRPTPPLD